MIRISQIHEGPKLHLFVEGTLSDGWVEALETSWLEARSQLNGEPLRIDLSDVTYVDDRGRELLARMIQSGAKLSATGIMTKAIVKEITEMIARDRFTEVTEFAARQAAGGTTKSTPENFALTANQRRRNNHV